MPAFLLSGFIFDVGSMPTVVQGITHLIAARYYVAILQTVFLAGDEWSVILPNAAGLAVLATKDVNIVTVGGFDAKTIAATAVHAMRGTTWCGGIVRSGSRSCVRCAGSSSRTACS